MAAPGGIGSSIGVAAESTYGTFITPARWFEFLDESFDYEKVIAQGEGLKGATPVNAANRRVIGTTAGSGDLNLEIPTKGLGLLLSMFMGASALTQQAATAAWLQVHTLTALLGKSLTIQKGVSSALGVVTPYTFLGCKGSKFELHASVGALVTGKFSFDAQDVVTSQSYAAPSYSPLSAGFVFAGGSIVVGGSPTFSTTALSTGGTALAQISDFSLMVDRALKNDRYYFNNSGKKAEPIDGKAKITIQMKADFIDTTLPAAYMADTDLSVVLTFVGATIASTYKETLQIVLPLVNFNGELPKINSAQIISMSVDGEVLDDRTNSPLYIGYQSSDTAL